MLDSSDRIVPRIIPDAILSVLCILEEDKDRFLWKLARNRDGLSLVIRTHHPVREHKGVHKKSDLVNHSASATNLEKDSSAKSRPVTVNETRKHKTPSALARDLARKRAFHRRKAASRKARKTAPVVTPSDQSQSETSVLHTSDVHTLECINPTQPDNSQCEPSVVITTDVQTLECGNETQTPDSPLLDPPRELDTQSDTSQESDIENELLIQRTFCVTCNKQATDCPNGLKACGQCKICHYCSKQCQASHWKSGHRNDCAELARLGALRVGNQC